MHYKLSPSKLNLFLDCPRCFWLDVVKNIKRPTTFFPSLPSGMDKILKKHFDNFMRLGELPPELESKEELRDCSLFSDEEKLKEWRNNRIGLQYEDKETGTILRGAIDNILVKGNKLIVLDYKTRGFPLKKDTHKHYELQMDLYNFLLRENDFKTENFAYLLFYYPNHVNSTGEIIFDTKLIKIRTNPKRGKKVFEKAIKVLNSSVMPQPSPNCEFCKWADKIKDN